MRKISILKFNEKNMLTRAVSFIKLNVVRNY